METIAQKISDNEVVERVLNGEKELYEILLRRNNQLLYRAIRSYLKEEADVEDAMQETYLRAYEKLRQYRGEAAFSTWLIRIGINEALQRLRGMKHEEFLHPQQDDAQQEQIIQIPDTMEPNPEKKAIQYETRKLIERAIDRLPEKYRIVFILREVEGMDNTEIASCLDISDANVKVRVHRAKELLKETLYSLSSPAEVFEFGSTRCDNITSKVMSRI